MGSETIKQNAEIAGGGQAAKSSFGSLLGVAVLSFVIILILAAVVLSAFEYHFFSTWVAFVFMCAVPSQLVIALLWETNYPPAIGKLSQPLKGICLTLMTVVLAGIIAFLMFTFAGKSVGPPTPMLMNFTIMTVVSTFWVLPIMNCWPITVFTKNPLIIGIGSLLMSYGIAWILFQTFFSFTFMAQAPVYVEALDPKGLFMSWTAISYFVTTTMAILILILSDMTLVPKIPGCDKQPLSGLIATGMVLIITTVIWILFTQVFGMDKAVFMVRIPVCFIFGVFMVNTMMQEQLLANLPQPARGLVLTGLALFCAVVMYYIYAFFGPILTGIPLLSGPPTYDIELWIANALLAITFPIITFVANYFGFWPVKRL